MLGQALLALVGIALILLSWPSGASADGSGWWGVVGGGLIVVGAALAAVRARRPGRVRRGSRPRR
ncbi:hypothetical protein [Clavibacter sp. MX14-G9D]|uniref:hypothetical protein n=1 Tax=Clavibacter sp. MX14-G9D TaxID=3064656 RepID=UPI00293F798C|nr:hypothetical protein [Clavibacter sp. MX14-G9D]